MVVQFYLEKTVDNERRPRSLSSSTALLLKDMLIPEIPYYLAPSQAKKVDHEGDKRQNKVAQGSYCRLLLAQHAIH